MTHRTAYSCPRGLGLLRQRVHNKTSKRKRQGQNLEKCTHKLQRLSPSQPSRDTWVSSFLQQKTCTQVQCFCHREAHYRDSAPKVFTGGWSQRQPLPSNYQNSRSPEENQVLAINHIICTNNLCDLTEQSLVPQPLSAWGTSEKLSFLRANPASKSF